MKAAELLIENSYCNVAMHSLYYSCLQLIKHRLLVVFELEEKDIDFNNGKSTHVDLIKAQNKYVQEGCKNRFKKRIARLKELRVIADYFPNELTVEEIESAVSIRAEVVDLINNSKK